MSYTSNSQVQLSLAASQGKDFFHQCSESSKSAIALAWDSSYPSQIKHNISELFHLLINFGKNIPEQIWLHLDPQKIYYNLAKVFWDKCKS